MNPDVLAEVVALDSSALDAAASIAEEALACHREAILLLAEGWRSETGAAIRDYMETQCAHATDVVDALHQASGRVTTVPGTWGDPENTSIGGRAADPADGLPSAADAGGSAPDLTVPVAPPPAPAPGPVPTWTGQVPAPPWAAPSAADAQWSAANAPGGPPAPPALPDFGGALVGLVAEIAQALGSYAEMAPAADVSSSGLGTGALGNQDSPAQDTSPGRDTSPAQDRSLGQDTPPSARAPGSAPPGGGHPESRDLSTTTPAVEPAVVPAPPPAPPPGLLAAERPPDPGVAASAPVADAPVVTAVPEVPAADSQPPAAPAPAANDKTPCEIAADELAKVGE